MTTTTDTKTFTGVLRKSFLEPNKSGEGAHWHIDIGDLQKPWGFNMFDEEEGERLALGKTYEITYVLKKNEKKPQFPPFKNFVSIREVEPAPAKPAPPAEQVSAPLDQSPPNPDKRTALLAMKPANIGDFYNKAMKELGYHSKAEVLAGLGVGVKETDIVDLVHALRTLVTKKYPEAKEA